MADRASSFRSLSRFARGVAARVQDAVAERTAPPIVTAVRRERLTSLGSRALAELHEHIVEAEREGVEGLIAIVGDGGAAVVAADARSSAREVRVYGIPPDEHAALAAALTRHGFRPEATRVTLDAAPPTDGDAIAIAYVSDLAKGYRSALTTLSSRLADDGVLLARTPRTAEKRAILAEICPQPAFETATRGQLLRVCRSR